MPDSTVEALKSVDGWLQGPIGHNAYPRNDPTWINPPLRKKFELFASVKPVKSYPNLPSVHKDVDIVFLREVTEGMQSSSVVFAGSGEFRPNDDISIGMRVVTRKGANRVAREAFEIARTRSRKKVTSVHKEPVYRLVCGMFAEECRKVAQEFPDCTLEEVLVDGFAMKLVMKPQQYDVVVTTNQFGDILTDEGAGIVGGLGSGARPVRRREPGNGPGDARFRPRHRRTGARQSIRDDHVGPDALRMAGTQTQQPAGDRGCAAHRALDGSRDRRSQSADGRPGWQGVHFADGRRSRRRRLIQLNLSDYRI